MNALFFFLSFLTFFSSLSAQPMAIIAHRGASAYEPENTVRSFKRAMKMGADMIELDVFLSKTGQLVIMHDETVDRTTNCTGRIKKSNWKKLKRCNAGKGEPIPLLQEVFDLAGNKIAINLDIKDADAVPHIAELIGRYTQKSPCARDKFIVTSFDKNIIHTFRTQYPEIKSGVIHEDATLDPVTVAQDLNTDLIVIDYKFVTQELMDRAHAAGKKVFAYTVNTKAIAKRLKKLQIDGIVTDYPDIMKNEP